MTLEVWGLDSAILAPKLRFCILASTSLGLEMTFSPKFLFPRTSGNVKTLCLVQNQSKYKKLFLKISNFIVMNKGQISLGEKKKTFPTC